MFSNLTWPQLNAVGRHAASYAAGAITMAAAWGIVDHVQATDLTNGISLIGDGVSQVAKGVVLIAGVLTPIYTAWRAAHSASPSEQAKAVSANMPEVTNGARMELISAVGDMPEVNKVIASPVVARSTDSSKVVSN